MKIMKGPGTSDIAALDALWFVEATKTLVGRFDARIAHHHGTVACFTAVVA